MPWNFCGAYERGMSQNKWCYIDPDSNSYASQVFTQDIVTGAMTYCFIQAVESGPGITYGNILLEMRAAIRESNRGFCVGGSISALLRKVFRTGLTQVMIPTLSVKILWFDFLRASLWWVPHILVKNDLSFGKWNSDSSSWVETGKNIWPGSIISNLMKYWNNWESINQSFFTPDPLTRLLLNYWGYSTSSW